MEKYYLVKDGRIDIKTSFDEGDLRERLERGELYRDDRISDCREQKRVDELDFLFPKNEYRIGIYGRHGSGKSAYLACLTRYGKPLDDGSLAVPTGRLRRNSQTVDATASLKTAWEGLNDPENPRSPEPTRGVQHARFSLTWSGTTWNVRTIDYQGDLTDGDVSETPEFGPAREVDSWFRNCDAILYMVDAADPSFDLQEMHRFVLAMQTDAEKRGLTKKPVAVVLSRWDRQEKNGFSFDNAEQNEIFREISSTLRAFHFPTRIVPVSVFGKCRPEAENLPVPDGLSPRRLAEPLLWALRRLDEMKVEQIENGSMTANPSSSASFRILQNVYKNELGIWGNGVDRILEEKIREIGERLGPLKRRNVLYRNLSLAALFLATAVLLSIFSVSFAVRDDEARFQTASFQLARAESRKEIDEALENYGRNKFIFPMRYRNELERTALEKSHEIRFGEAKSELDDALRHAVNFEETKRLYDDFLDEFTDEKYPDRADAIREIRDAFQKTIDEERRGIQFLSPTAFEKKIERIDAGLKAFDRNDPRREEFVEDRRQIAGEWDRDDYRKFYESVQDIKSAKDLLSANERAGLYLETSSRRDKHRVESRFRQDVEAWTEWFDGLKKEHPLTFKLKTLRIPRSFFKDPQLESKITITLQIGSVKEKSVFVQLPASQKSSDPVRLDIDLDCTIDKAAWNEKKKTKISLTVAESWGWVGGAKALCSLSDSPYPYFDFSPPPKGVFDFAADEKIDIRVETELQGFALPEIPEP